MPTTNIKIISPLVDFNYYLQDYNLTVIDNGELTVSPTTINTVSYTTAEVDWIEIFFSKYGYQFGDTRAVFTATETILYVSHKVDTHIEQPVAATVAAYSPSLLTVDKALKRVSVAVGTTDRQVYDYMQYWLSLPANADELPTGKIYDTLDDVIYFNKAGWVFYKTGNEYEIYVAISAIDRTGEDVPGSNGQFQYKASFTTPALALADGTWGYNRSRDANGERTYYECFLDGSPYVGTSELSLGNSTINNYMVLRAAYGHGHNGYVNAGVSIENTTQYASAVKFINGYPRIENLRLSAWNYGLRCNYVNGGRASRIIANGCTNGFYGGAAGCSTRLINCLAYENENGFAIAGYSSIEAYGCVAVNNSSKGFDIATGASNPGALKNCLAVGNGTDFVWAGGNTSNVTHNASGDLSAPPYGTYITDLDTTHPNLVFIDAAAKNYHLNPAADSLIGAGVDLSSVYDNDIDGKPWILPHSIGMDQLGDILFVSYIKLSSLVIGVNYYAIDHESNLIGSGLLDLSPKKLAPAILATSLSDLATVYSLHYGYKYRVSVVPFITGDTPIFIPNDVNNNTTLDPLIGADLTRLNAIASFTTVNTTLKTVTFAGAVSQSEAYDYLQWYQFDVANAATLAEGELFNTVIGITHTILTGWKFIFTVAPTGSWNVVGDVQLGAVMNLSNFNINGTLYFDIDGAYSISNSVISSVDVVTGDETIVITPTGTTNITTNVPGSPFITINSPAKTLTLTGLINLSDVVILAAGTDTVLDSVDQGGTTFGYVYTTPHTIDIGVVLPGYVTQYIYGVVLGTTDASLPVKQSVDRNYS